MPTPASSALVLSQIISHLDAGRRRPYRRALCRRLRNGPELQLQQQAPAGRGAGGWRWVPGHPPPGNSVVGAVRQLGGTAEDLARLTDSFHLNLTAFGLLSFAVGLFIVNGAVGLAFEQRRPVFRTLRALGVTSSRLVVLLILELLVLALIAGALGIGLGYVIAAALLPDVAATLRGLYGATVEGTLTLSPAWWLSGIAIAVAGTALAALTALWTVARLTKLKPTAEPVLPAHPAGHLHQTERRD